MSNFQSVWVKYIFPNESFKQEFQGCHYTKKLGLNSSIRMIDISLVHTLVQTKHQTLLLPIA